jgi:hypothetical protein
MQISEVSFDWKFMVLVWGDLRIHTVIRLQLKIGSVNYKKDRTDAIQEFAT